MFRPLMSRRVVRIMLNGRERQVGDGSLLSDLLAGLDLPADGYAVEVNGRLVPRSEARSRLLRAGDQVEVVTLVGGG
ncbi:MAG: sulfur carrier protein ThiS [Planctomycetes bacterium]|nr:sulfur carrier protein ThiS [Planctomycetota bacterium]